MYVITDCAYGKLAGVFALYYLYIDKRVGSRPTPRRGRGGTRGRLLRLRSPALWAWLHRARLNLDIETQPDLHRAIWFTLIATVGSEDQLGAAGQEIETSSRNGLKWPTRHRRNSLAACELPRVELNDRQSYRCLPYRTSSGTLRPTEEILWPQHLTELRIRPALNYRWCKTRLTATATPVPSFSRAIRSSRPLFS
ncbi:hypothetical protein PH5382_03874 [Phaeobacter sp. CECT 5382]|nr:hypothetical protein PH5382_03874 [Phaeobacter sp. CECT 5382]